MTTATVWKRKGCGPCERVMREVVPRLEAAGVRVTVKDVHDHPCEAMREGVTMVPTIVAETPAGTVRARGYPPEEAVADIIGDTGAGRPPSHTRPSSEDVKNLVGRRAAACNSGDEGGNSTEVTAWRRPRSKLEPT